MKGERTVKREEERVRERASLRKTRVFALASDKEGPEDGDPHVDPL